MKIIFCMGSMGNGGAERVVANLSNYMVKKHDVSIISTILQESAYELDSKIDYINLDNKIRRGSIIIRTLKRVLKLRKILKERKPDVVISFLPEPSYRLMIAKIFLKIKTIISVRNDPNVEYNTFLKKVLVKILYTKADGFVFQTEDAKRYFSKKIQKKSIIIPNPINQDFLVKSYEGMRKKEIVTVGRLTEQKNHKLLISAFYEFHKKYPTYFLKIFGEGNQRQELQEYIKKLKLEEYAFLMGQTKNVKNDIYSASMFVLSSDYEGMPNALMEAMALGLPCISTNCPIGGPKFLIENNKNGILVGVRNKEELVSAMIKIVKNKLLAERISKAANEIGNKLNPDIINKTWEDYICNIIHKKGELNGRNFKKG